jgi:hypothetical protein
MIDIILHRANSPLDIVNYPTNIGAEIDIRNSGSKLYLHHEFFADPDDCLLLENYLDFYAKDRPEAMLILNVKFEGGWRKMIKMCLERGIHNFQFLDNSDAEFMTMIGAGENRVMRQCTPFDVPSEAMLGLPFEWLWVDTLNGDFPERDYFPKKVCLVSPELMGCDKDLIKQWKPKMTSVRAMSMEAVCTDYPDLWRD